MIVYKNKKTEFSIVLFVPIFEKKDRDFVIYKDIFNNHISLTMYLKGVLSDAVERNHEFSKIEMELKEILSIQEQRQLIMDLINGKFNGNL